MRTLMTISMLMLGCGVASAQMTMAPAMPSTGSALGATSPLGISGMISSTPPSQAGIPLGATQLNVGGLSPAPGPLAGSACSTVSSLSSSGLGTFDGGGLSGTSGAAGMTGMSGTGSTGSIGCGTTSATTGTASGLVLPGTTGASTTGVGTIPLGATEIDGGGESPMIVTPAPSSTITTPGMTSSP